MLSLFKGRYLARTAQSPGDVLAAQRLRHLAFSGGKSDDAAAQASQPCDSDAYDSLCTHILVEDRPSQRLVCCYRLLPLRSGADIARSYSAQFYDLSALCAFPGPLLEVGRFCLHPDWHDPDILRIAWGAMTRIVDATASEMLFGCTSFNGTDSARYLDAFALLKQRHLAPQRWLPQIKSPEVVRFAREIACGAHDPSDGKRAQLTLPPLLRTYLMMGGWVSDHAVVDRQMNTLHVFTGLEIRKIPPARARLLRAVAG